jgi:uncharacterized membrane protein
MEEKPIEQSENIQKSAKGELKAQITAEVKFSSPLPPPDVLKKYAEIQPDFPERIVRMVEKEQSFRHKVILLGELFGFVVVIGGFVSAVVLGIYGKEWLAGTIGLGAISSIVGAYFYGKFRAVRDKEKQQ